VSKSQAVEKNQFDPPKWVLKLMSRTHILLNRLTLGRMFNTLQGDEVCFVTMTGARSGRAVTVPLMYVPYEDGVLLVASRGGSPRHPVWYHNIARNPDIDVRYRGRTMKLHARLATSEEKPALWPICDSHYAPYADYRARTDREIPIFICKPC
jgi:deazaflavin-dependent oxidoreductase (nitroreductase family)